ncbi:uncharacterized protein LOC142600112 [Balearica regulorum gibbericeps]|uniref:uncharacterized protein LOC142600112 n=1 Tax=Balearica regulorum gibbericeps TaxID=100784 RepID=UPI003F5FC587
MQAAEVKEDLRMLRERLARCSAESKRHKELLRCLGKKQQELQVTMQELSTEHSVVAQSFQNNRQELQQLEGLVAQTKEHFQMTNREAATSPEEAEKRHQWSELAEAIQEQTEVKKLLRNKVQRLLERLECLQEPATFRRKTAQADETEESLMQEMVAVRLEEQLAPRRRNLTSWLRGFLLFLAFLQLAILILVLLKSDIFNWVLPPKMAVAFGSHPAKSQFF